MTKMKDYFSVDRKRWARGGRKEEFGATCLLNNHGNRCCLGHYCQQLGVPDEYMDGRGDPPSAAQDGDYEIPDLVEWLGNFAHCTHLTRRAIDINDEPHIDDAERERRLTALFAEHGIEVEFYDG